MEGDYFIRLYMYCETSFVFIIFQVNPLYIKLKKYISQTPVTCLSKLISIDCIHINAGDSTHVGNNTVNVILFITFS